MSLLSGFSDVVAPGSGAGIELLETQLQGAEYRLVSLNDRLTADAHVIAVLSSSFAAADRGRLALAGSGEVCDSRRPITDPAGIHQGYVQLVPTRAVGKTPAELRAALRTVTGDPALELVAVKLRDSGACQATNFVERVNRAIKEKIPELPDADDLIIAAIAVVGGLFVLWRVTK